MMDVIDLRGAGAILIFPPNRAVGLTAPGQ